MKVTNVFFNYNDEGRPSTMVYYFENDTTKEVVVDSGMPWLDAHTGILQEMAIMNLRLLERIEKLEADQLMRGASDEG